MFDLSEYPFSLVDGHFVKAVKQQEKFTCLTQVSKQFRFQLKAQRLQFANQETLNRLVLTNASKFNEKRDDVFAVLNEVEVASKKSVKSMVSFVDRFYKTINSERRVKSDFVKRCI